MKQSPNPYAALPPHAFWRTGVAEPGLSGMTDLWQSKWSLPANAHFATFGSCFAQHISRALQARKVPWVNAEPAPGRMPAALAAMYNYNVYSARTANIYTAAQLRLLLTMAMGQAGVDAAEVWESEGRFFDSLRPAIEPQGFASRDEALLSRQSMLRALRASAEEADVFVFTLGLTEGWQSLETGQPYAMCPGTAGGTFDANLHGFVNYRAAGIRADLEASLALLQSVNADIRLLLTVSPVPLTATASGQHVLLATTRSKAVLRGVAGEFAEDMACVDYFPSYEVITGPQTKSAFYEANLRSVLPEGVAVVMGHFFAGLRLDAPARERADTGGRARFRAARDAMRAEALACEEAMLEAHNAA
jgi:GSCFA family